MSFVNFSTKEITSKIVYYGPGLCGKTTTLQYIYDSIVPENKGQMVSLATDVDRTIYFDFLPLKLGKIQDFSVRIQLYTVPGQVRYNSTRKLVLSGTDGVVFVTDSQADLLDENTKSYKNLIDNLKEHGLSLSAVPHILQFNKRDLPRLRSVDELDKGLNQFHAPYFETCATTGEGVLEGLKTISKLVMQDLNRKGVVNKKRVKSINSPGVNRTDWIQRPMVGRAATLGEDSLFGRPSEALAEDDGDDIAADLFDGIATTEANDRRGRERAPNHTISFAALFDEPEAATRIVALERSVDANDAAQVQKLARESFLYLIEDSRFFPPDMTESSRISMLGVSLRKYAHFYRLLSQVGLNRSEALFLLHFVIDVHFGKGMP